MSVLYVAPSKGASQDLNRDGIICVKGVSPQMPVSEVLSLFAPFGRILDCTRSRGNPACVYIKYKSGSDAERAVAGMSPESRFDVSMAKQCKKKMGDVYHFNNDNAVQNECLISIRNIPTEMFDTGLKTMLGNFGKLSWLQRIESEATACVEDRSIAEARANQFRGGPWRTSDGHVRVSLGERWPSADVARLAGDDQHNGNASAMPAVGNQPEAQQYVADPDATLCSKCSEYCSGGCASPESDSQTPHDGDSAPCCSIAEEKVFSRHSRFLSFFTCALIVAIFAWGLYQHNYQC